MPHATCQIKSLKSKTKTHEEGEEKAEGAQQHDMFPTYLNNRAALQ